MELTYETYTTTNIDHVKLLHELNKENMNLTFLGTKENIFIVRNKLNLIGAITLQERTYAKEALALEVAILKKEQKKGYGSYIFNDIPNYVFSKGISEKIILEISPINFPSLKAAIRSGYEIDYDILSHFRKEDYRYISYSKKRLIKTK